MLNRFLLMICIVILSTGWSESVAAWSGFGWIDRSFRVEMLDEGVYLGSAPRTDEDFARLRQMGVKHIIDIRSFKLLASAREATRAARFGMKYERIPSGFFPTTKNTVPRIMSRLKDKPCGAVFFHCNLGSDRTGMISALYRVNVLGWDAQVAFQQWKSTQFNTRLKDLDRYFWQNVMSGCCELQEASHQLDVTSSQHQSSSLLHGSISADVQQQSGVDPSGI